MGSIADALIEYCQPFMEGLDGSQEQLQKALSFGQLFWNIALTPDSQRASSIAALQSSMKMDDAEFEAFKREMVYPMIERHKAMFPAMHGAARGDSTPSEPIKATLAHATQRPAKKYAGTGRNERCPCGSGKKYKVCCGR